VRSDFTPDGVEQHRCINEHQFMQYVREVRLSIRDYLLQRIEDAFRGQLHNFTAEIDDPNQLLPLL